jgi:AraC-like DNA-binding protein
MSIILPEIEIVDSTTESLRYLEHGWPSELCRWHAHEECELHLIVGATGKAFVGDHIGTFGHGSLFLIGPNLPHNWVTEFHESEPLELRDMLVQFNRKTLKQAASGFHELRELNPLLDMARSGIEFVDFPFEVAHESMCRIRETEGVERMVAFLSFLDVINKHSEKAVLSTLKLETKSGNKNYDKIGDVVDYLVKNYNQPLSVADAAAMAGMSETSFSRNFHNSTGNRFVDFVNQVRIGHACLLLQETNMRISSICYEVGFQNLANFNRHFFKMKQITPSGYRSSVREGLQSTSASGQGLNS